MADYRQALIDAMNEAGITDPEERAGIAAIAGGESNFRPHTEIGYQHTGNDRIRQIFSKTRNMGDDELDDLKADPRRFFNFVYGGRFGNVTGTDDGYTYRGRGPFQLTFKDNYKRIGDMIGQDLVANPDLVNDPAIGAKSVVAYTEDRYDGSGWEAMKDASATTRPISPPARTSCATSSWRATSSPERAWAAAAMRLFRRVGQ